MQYENDENYTKGERDYYGWSIYIIYVIELN